MIGRIRSILQTNINRRVGRYSFVDVKLTRRGLNMAAERNEVAARG